ncbi:AsmA family protein [Telmatobacter sp. DSM 110680]|uniref:AsmA family protein n=1 Tax=Telmatobacter sp. DSM 110680 TaxID=3036704 RepID=A0AAU7DCU8_9BACT
MLKQWVLVVAAVVFLLLFVISLVPFFVNAESFRPTIESQLSSALGRQVTVGSLTFSIMAGSLDAEDISIADDPNYSAVPFIQAKKLNVGVEIFPIVFSHSMHITKLNIDTPSIQLIQNANGKWNFSSLGGSNQAATTQQHGSMTDLVVEELKITNGSAMVSSIPQTDRPFEYTEVNITVKDFSFQKSFPFELLAKLPGDGTLKLSGDAGPISQTDASKSPFQATLQLKNFDPVASGVIDKSKGIKMQNDVDAQLKSDGTTVSSTGKIKASQLQLVPRGSPSQDPVDIDYNISDNLETRKGTLADVAVHAGSAAVHATGSFQFTPQAIMLDVHLAAPNLPIDQLERLLPVVGIHLPAGSSLQGGTITANINVTGPATTATLAGPVEIDNTKLAGFDLGSKIQGLNPFGGTSGGTEIQVLKANVNSSPDGARITDIYGNLPQIGSATGEGTVSPTSSINFNLTATLNSSNAVGAVANTAVNAVGGLVGSFLHPGAKPKPASSHGIPLTITGTATNPTIKANIGAMLR